MFWNCQSRLLVSSWAATLLLYSGCVVGPNFKKPAARMSAVIRPRRLPPLTPRPASLRERSNTCWTGKTFRENGGTLFHSQALDDLIERSLKANPDIKAAQAAFVSRT